MNQLSASIYQVHNNIFTIIIAVIDTFSDLRADLLKIFLCKKNVYSYFRQIMAKLHVL